MATPTNSDIIKEVRETRDVVTTLVHDVNDLKDWKIAVEAARQAIKEDREAHPRTPKPDGVSPSTKLLAAAISLIAVLGGVIVILAQASK